MAIATCSAMKVALPIWDDRVSPVFDVAHELLVAEIDGGTIRSQMRRLVDSTHPAAHAQAVANHGVQVLICGAISQALAQLLQSHGVQVISRKCGDAGEVLEAYLKNTLDSPQYAMPGCQPSAGPMEGTVGTPAINASDGTQMALTCCAQVDVQVGDSEDTAMGVDRRWIAVVGSHAVGELELHHDHVEGWVRRFKIEPGWQNSPAPCRLLQEALSYCRQQGLVKLTVEVALVSRRAMRLFTCLGFQNSRNRDNDGSRRMEFYLNLYQPIDEAQCRAQIDDEMANNAREM